MSSLREDLADWVDWDVAAHSYGNAIGIFDGATRRQVNRVVLGDEPLGRGLHEGIAALVSAGVLERRDEPEEQYRWVYAGTADLPEVAGSGAGLTGMPPQSDHQAGEDPAPAGDRPWWRRGAR